MKKTKKALASLAIAGMALSAVPYNAFAATTVPTRLAGTTAEQTAVAIADQTGWTGTAVLASSTSYGMVDALTAGPLATFLKAPILLQGAGNTLNADTKAELQKLNITTVYVTSGTAVISQSVLDQLSGMGITVVSLGGKDRFETSANIAKKMVELGAPVTKAAVAYGWLSQDALSIASIASSSNEPILLTDKNSVPPSVQSFLNSTSTITSSDVIGGTGVISDAVKAEFPNATRHFGTTAYDTNNQVIQDFSSSLKFDNVYVANGKTGIDALAGSPLAAQTSSPIVLTDGTVPAAATFVHSKLGSNSVVTALGGTAVVSDDVRTGIINGTTTPPQGDLAVTSVTASAANSIKVSFNGPVADTSKVTFKVTNSNAAAVVTTSWSDDKSSATLSGSSNFAEGAYSVDVTNGDTDLGTSSVQFTAQRVAKIEFASNTLAVVSGGKTGYVAYSAYDQYGNNITDKYLASSSYITWSCGIGDITSDDKGILTVHPFGWDATNDKSTTVLTQYPSTVVTAVTKSQTIPTSANATLTVSTQVGTISDITLNKLVTADGQDASPTIGDSEKYYIDYTAKDMSGNDTASKTLVESGLITNSPAGQDAYQLVTSNSQLVKAKLVDDPSDDTKSAIEVDIQDPTDYTMTQDQPITITATTYTGKTSSVTFTLKRAQKVNTFTLMAPSETISSGETGVVIPFAAYDQNGNQLTKYSDITKDNVVALSPAKNPSDPTSSGLYFEENADGTASLKYDAPVNSGTTALQETLNATVNNTGNFSSININVDQAKVADSLKLDDSVLVPNMEVGSHQALDFGFNDGGFSVQDQYGRAIDMTSKYVINGVTYYVQASLPQNSVLSFDNNQDYAYAGHEVVLDAGNTAGSATVTFKLMASAKGAQPDPTNDTVLDTKTLSMTVLADKDISDYTMTTAPNAIYAASDKTSPTAQEKDQNVKVIVYGKTSSGSLVVIDPSKTSIGTSSSSDFYTFMGDDATQTKVAANQLDASKTGSSATISAVVYNDNDKRYHSVTTTVTSKTDDPAAQSMGFYAQTVDRKDSMTATGITYDGTTVTVDLSGTQTQYGTQSKNAANLGIASSSVLNAIAGRDLTRYTNSDVAADANTDALTAGGDNRGYVYLYALNQYGSKDMNLSQVKIADSSKQGNTPVATIDNNMLIFNYVPTANDYIVVSGVSTNGLVETIKIQFTGSLS